MDIKILSSEEHERLSTIPPEIGGAELVRFFTLQPTDLALLDPRAKPAQHLNQSTRVYLLRRLGWSPVRVQAGIADIGIPVLAYPMLFMMISVKSNLLLTS